MTEVAVNWKPTGLDVNAWPPTTAVAVRLSAFDEVADAGERDTAAVPFASVNAVLALNAP